MSARHSKGRNPNGRGVPALASWYWARHRSSKLQVPAQPVLAAEAVTA